MKKLSWVTGALTCVMVLLAALGAVCGAIDQIAVDEDFYSGMSRTAVAKYLGVENDPQIRTKVTEYIGMDDAAQTVFAQDIAAFMAGETDVLPADVLNEKEQQHMLDVRALTQSAAQASKTCMTVAAVLAVLLAWLGAKLKRRVLPRLIGCLAAVSVAAIAAVCIMNQMHAGGFETMFVAMHEALFSNDLWMLDPQTDILIRMMPQPLFEQALADVVGLAARMFVIVIAMLLAVMISVERMLRQHVVKGE